MSDTFDPTDSLEEIDLLGEVMIACQADDWETLERLGVVDLDERP